MLTIWPHPASPGPVQGLRARGLHERRGRPRAGLRRAARADEGLCRRVVVDGTLQCDTRGGFGFVVIGISVEDLTVLNAKFVQCGPPTSC